MEFTDELDDLLGYFGDNSDLEDVEGVHVLIKEIRDQQEGRRDKKDFQLEENLVAIGVIAYLASKFKRYGDVVTQGFDKSIISIENGKIDEGTIEKAMNQFDNILKDTFMNSKQELAINLGLGEAIERGMRLVTRSRNVISNVDYNAVLRRSAESLHYYTKTSFGRVIVPKVQKTIAKVVDDPNKMPQYLDLRDQITNYYKNDNYGRLVANSYSNRAYNWGVAKSAKEQGFEFVEYVAVLDDRTTEICRHLNGKVFDLDKSLARLEAAITAKERNLEHIDPWLDVESVIGKSISEIEDIGGNTPGKHPNCRSILRPIKGSVLI